MNFIVITILCIVIVNNNIILTMDTSNNENNEEVDPTESKEEDTYPYMVAILKKTTFISAGALIDEKWVVTAADSFFLIREAVRTLRVRLGSPNYKYGGILTAVKYLQIHPNFDDSKPEFDIALIRLSETVKLTPNLNPIKLQTKLRNITSSHFTVTGWHSPLLEYTKKNYVSKESLQQRQLLSVSHLHPTNKNDCLNQLEMLEANNTDIIMCLDWAITNDPCERETGAAVALNGVLWGIVSSWKSEDCDVDKGPLFVTRVSPVKIGSWIHSTIHGHRWSQKHTVDYRDNFF